MYLVFTIDKTNFEVNEHEALFQNLNTMYSTSGKHDGQLRQLNDTIRSTSDEILNSMSNYKDTQNVLLGEIRDNTYWFGIGLNKYS